MNEEKPTRPLAISVILAIVVVICGTAISDLWFDVDYRIAANCSLIAAAVFVNIFTFMYGFRSRWRSNRIGGIFLVKCVGLSLFLNQAALSTWWDTDYPWRQQIRFGIYATMSVVYVPMVVTLWQQQRVDRANRAAQTPLPGVPPL